MVRAKKSKDSKGIASAKAFTVLRKPIITEKTSVVGAAGDVVVFKVDRNATKTDIKDAVERIFNKTVIAVRTANILGKPKRTQKSSGRRAAYKKAYVKLAEGQTIDLVEGL